MQEGIAYCQHSLASSLSKYKICDRLRHVRDGTAFVEKIGQVDTVVIIVFQIESLFVSKDCGFLVGSIVRYLPQSFVNSPPQPQRFGVG